MPELLQGRPLPSSQRRPTWKTGSQVSRGGKLIDVELLGDISGNVALGRMGHVGVVSDVTGITTEQDVTGLSVTFDAVAGRYYKITWFLRFTQNTTTGTVTARLRRDSTNISGVGWTLGAGGFDNATLVAIDSPGEGSVTYKARIGTSAGSVTVLGSATAPEWIIVEDIGL